MVTIRGYINKIILTVFLMITQLTAWADEYEPVFGSNQPASVSSMSDNLMEPITMVRHLCNAASILLGIYMIIAAIQNYFKHRRTPHEASLTTVILGFIMGIIFLLLPLTYQIAVRGEALLGS